MKKIFFTLLLIGSFSFAQVDSSDSELAEQKKLGDFYKVTTFDQIDVQLVKSDENKIIIHGADANKVEIVNKNGELKIRMPFTKLLQGDNISATLYYTKLEALEANEGSRIVSSDLLRANQFNILLKEGAQIKLTIETSTLKVRVANGSVLELEGTSRFVDALINSGGIYKAKDLKTIQTTITANAGGEAEVYALEFVDAKVRAGGNILIFGKPKQINQKVVAGGSIEQAN